MARYPLSSLVFLLALSPLHAATLRVPGDYASIQGALDAAVNGDTVLVAPGEYVITEPLSFNRAGPLKNIVLRSEAGAEATTIRMGDELTVPGEASVIVFERGESARSRLEGFTITGGRGRTENDPIGGGILCAEGSSPRVSGCRILGNSAMGPGGFQNGGMGGGIYCKDGSDIVLENCVIADNIANLGAGVCCEKASPVLDGCLVSGNAATSQGGGMFCSATPLELMELIDCRFDGNTAQQGGAVFLQGCIEPLIESCVFSGNHADGSGGGMHSESSSPQVEDCTFLGNSASQRGGAAFLSGVVPDSDSLLAHCTIVGNQAPTTGGLHCEESGTLITSCILWDNSGGSLSLSGRAQVIFSCVDSEPPWLGKGNLSDDPLFAGWGSRDEVYVDASRPGPGTGSETDPYSDIRAALSYSLALTPESPCIGASEFRRDIGAGHGVTEGERKNARRIHLAPGRYDIRGATFAYNLSLEGAGAEQTTLVGRIGGLRTGSTHRGVTVTGGVRGAITVGDEAPRIVDCTVMGNSNPSGGVIHCFERSSPTFERCRITGNNHDPRPRVFGFGRVTYVTAAVQCDRGSTPTFVDCVISDNHGIGLSANGARPVLTACRIAANSAAGIDMENSNPELRHCVITGNGGGGLYLRNALPLIEHCTIAGNVGVSAAGGVYATQGSRPEIASSILWGNPGGSLLAEDGSRPRVSHSCIEGETVWDGQGNINLDPLFCGWGAASEVHVDPTGEVEGDGSRDRPYLGVDPALAFRFALAAGSPCVATGKDGSDMGVEGPDPPCESSGQPRRTIHLAPGTYRLSGPSFAHGISIVGAGPERTVIEGTVSGLASGTVLSGVTITGGSGVVVGPGASPRIENVVVTGSSDNGVTCSVTATPALIDCTISESQGHGVACWLGSAPTLTRCTITRNAGVPGKHGRPFGGGVYCGGFTRLVLVDCILADNYVSGLWCQSGDDDVTLRRCRISGNLQGGVQAGGTRLSMTNCLVVGHSDGSGSGVGVQTGNSATRITNCTITENSVGAEISGGTVTNSIVWGNTQDGVKGSARIDYSLLQNEGWIGPENENSVGDPLFRVPGQQGVDGFWAPGDYRLKGNSPAIDAGTNEGAPAVDLDGVPRPCNRFVDLGAYEHCEAPPVAFRRGDSNDDGGVNTSDAVFMLLYSFRGGAPPPCRDAADTDDDGAITITDPVFLLNHLFGGGNPPPPPFEECGGDLTEDELDCQSFAPCE